MIVLFIILGACFGSFYHALAIRLSNDESIIAPGSHCEYCKKPLKWYELIPVISYIIQRGRCNNCHKKLPISYLLVELILGLLSGLGYYLYGFSYELYAYLVIISITTIIFISDFKYMIILDYPLYICIIIILILKYIYFGTSTLIYALISGIILSLFMLLIKIFGDRIYKRESLGWGDVKLAFFMGVTLALRLGLFSLILGSLIAMPYAIYFITKKEVKEIPYGPFLILAVLITYIFMSPIGKCISMFFLIK